MILALAGAGSVSAVIIAVVISATASAKVVGSTTIVEPMIGTIPLLLTIIIIAAYILEIIGAVFYLRMFNKLREKSGVRQLNTAGILYLVGIMLTIVAIGGLIVWIAFRIYATSGFNSLKPKLPNRLI